MPAITNCPYCEKQIGFPHSPEQLDGHEVRCQWCLHDFAFSETEPAIVLKPKHKVIFVPKSDYTLFKSPKQKIAEQKALNNMAVAVVCTIFAGGFLLVCVVVGSLGSAGSSRPNPETISDKKAIVWWKAKEFVKGKLKSPGTASFGSVFSSDYQDSDSVVSSLSGNRYRVRAWVDAQNSFGAQMRTNFTCELQYLGNDQWRYTALTLGE